jgi:hypothetical protein
MTTLTGVFLQLLVADAPKLGRIIRKFDPSQVQGHVTSTCHVMTERFMKAGEEQTIQGTAGQCGLTAQLRGILRLFVGYLKTSVH